MSKHRLSNIYKAILVASLTSALAVGCGGGDHPNDTPAVTIDQVRNVTDLTKNWRFVFDEGLSDEQAIAANKSNWSSVNLPHTWNAIDAATTAQSTPSTPLYQRGVGWYELQFDADAQASGTKWLQFDAASITADIWLNGTKLGQHRGAFTAFRYDVTSLLKAGRNVLVVKTDNRRGARDGDPTANR